MKISEQLKKQRKINGLSQQELADQLHITRQSVSKWENGTALPSFSNVIAISDLFGISLDELIKKDDELKMKFEKNTSSLSILAFLFTAIPVAMIIYIIANQAFGVNQANFLDWVSVITFVSFIGMLFTVDWGKIKKTASKWSIIWTVLFFLTLIMSGIPSFVQGLMQGIADGSKSL